MGFIDVTNGEVLRRVDLSMTPLYWTLPAFRFGSGCLTGYGASSWRTCYDKTLNDYGFIEFGFNRGPFTDAGILGTVDTARGRTTLRWNVDAGRVVGEYVRSDGEVDETSLRAPTATDKAWYSAGGPVVGKPRTAYFSNDYKRALVVTGDNGQPGQIWYGDITNPSGGTLAGTTGDGNHDTRQIRCALPICAISNFGGRVVTLSWDGVNAPKQGFTIQAGTNAVGIDVRAEGNHRVVRSADYSNRTVTKTVVSTDGALLSSKTKALPEACRNPGHVTAWEQPGETVKTLVSCRAENGSVIIVVEDRYFDE
jgi:hypothetical protein